MEVLINYFAEIFPTETEIFRLKNLLSKRMNVCQTLIKDIPRRVNLWEFKLLHPQHTSLLIRTCKLLNFVACQLFKIFWLEYVFDDSMSNVHIYVMGYKLWDKIQQAQKIPDMLSYINKHLLSSIIRSTKKFWCRVRLWRLVSLPLEVSIWYMLGWRRVEPFF